jgi:carboxyl-terminal processing protease
MSFPTKKQVIIFSVVIVIALSFGVGGFLGWKKGISTCKVCPPEDVDFSLLWTVWKDLSEKYVDPTKLNVQNMIYGAISGMVKSIGDPYTVFFNPEETKKFIEDASGIFEGIGAEVDVKNDQLLIVSPLEGTPAQKAGLRAGDKILKINDTLTNDLTIDEAVSLIRGPKGTEVTLTILREGWDQSKDFKMVRDVIKVPSLKWEIKTTPQGEQVAYLKLHQFSENATNDFKKAALEILASPAQKMILDLRDNPGGYLEVAQDISGWFLERGSVITIEDFGQGKEKNEYKAQGNEELMHFPLVVLINHGSASASEILGGALRDDRGILLIGETSFGKGSIQQLEDLVGGSSLKVTIAKWLTPKGESITDKGLEPDIKVEITEQDYQDEKDPQLDKALEVIGGIK